MIRQNFTQLISTIGTTLTNKDNDTNNNFVNNFGSNKNTIVLTGFIGVGNANDTIDITVNGTRFELATGNQINMIVESITLNRTTSATLSNNDLSARNISTGTTANTQLYNATNPGVLIFGYGIAKTLF